MRGKKPSRAGGLRRYLTMMLAGGLWVAAARGAERGLPIVSVFAREDVGSVMPAWTTVQDRDGVLYFGGDGIADYDGVRWHGTPLHRYYLRGLDFGRDGRLWAGAVDELGWYARDTPEEWTFHSLVPFLPAGHARPAPIWYAFAEENGAVFFSEDEVMRWDGKAFQIWPMPGARRLAAMRVGKEIYFHHSPTGMYRLEAGGPKLIIPAEVFHGAVVAWMEARGADWLFASSAGLFLYHEGALQPFAPEASEYLRREVMICGLRLPDGRLALGTLRGGLLLVKPDGTIDRVLTRAEGLPDTGVYSLFSDREGGLWVTSSTRVFRLSLNSGSSFFNEAWGLGGREALRVVRHRGEIMVATENGVYALPDNETRFHAVEGLRYRLSELRSTPEGLLFGRIRTAGRWENGKVDVLHRMLQEPAVTMASSSMPGTVLIAEGKSIFAVNAAGETRVLVKNLPSTASSLAEDSRGRLWLGTFTADVLVAKPDALSPVEAELPPVGLGLPHGNGGGSVLVTRTGTIVVFARAGGWLLPRGAEKFEAIADYPARRIESFSYAATDDSVWLIHPESDGRRSFIARVKIQGEHAAWAPHTVEGLAQVGIPSSILADVADASGVTTLWVGGTKGLLRHEVTRGLVSPTPWVPVLRAFAGNAEESALRLITGPLPYLTKTVRFEFSVPEFSRRDALKLETFIEGIDRGWVAADAAGRRELTALRDGQYVFRVRTVAETGAMSAPAEFRFEISPPWWRTAPAMVGVLLSLVPAAYGIFRLRVRALRRHNAELEEKVRHRTEQLARASAAKTEFVANISHDIRNPLNGIVGLALALEDTRLDRKQREIVATLRECTTYLSTLVDDVLDFASIEAGKVELRPGPFAPPELLGSVALLLKSEAAEYGGTLVVSTDSDLPPTLLGDAGRIQQILVNYTGNALKYAGGTIRISATLAPDSVDEVEFSVADDGPGLSDEEKATLFTKFTRLTNARRDAIPGAGLGLAACRLLADLMGGSVGVESALGLGSRFYLRLPLTAVTEAVVETASSLPSATVLVVEDADYNAWAAAAVLSKLGLPHERARNGREALELIGRKRFDVVLLDRNLPDMDGTEVAKRIRVLEADGPHAILLAVTAYCTAEDRALCLASGMDEFVGKPLTPHKLRRVLLAAGRRQLAAASVQVSPEAVAPAGDLDVSLLRYISDGSEQGLDEQVERFLATLAEADDALSHAASLHDFSGVAGVSHQILSQGRMIAATALETSAAALEQSARAGDQRAFSEPLLRVRREMAGVRATLRRRRGVGIT